MKKYILGLFFFIIFACQNEKKFEWSKDLKQTVKPNLQEWLQKSPFNGIWNKKDKDNFIIDNRDQVFPFLANFKNENDNFSNTSEKEKFYKQETILFKDSIFGESFVYGALLYEPEELFLKQSYSEMGNVIFSGKNAINERYHAELSETKIVNETTAYKTAIYWVNSNGKELIFGFYQKGKLIFQFGFPCSEQNKLQGLKKIKEINDKLNLNIKEWNKATEESLSITTNPKSFWKNPFIGLYYGEYGLPDIQVKIKNSCFKTLSNDLVKENNVDYIFACEYKNRQSTISLKREKTKATKQEFEDNFKNKEYIISNNDDKLFILEEKLDDQQKSLDLKTYTKNNSLLNISISYPENIPNAKKQIFDILKNLKIRKF